jgi:hypothetical protein
LYNTNSSFNWLNYTPFNKNYGYEFSKLPRAPRVLALSEAAHIVPLTDISNRNDSTPLKLRGLNQLRTIDDVRAYFKANLLSASLVI